jgi:hypothetical protein
MLKVVETDDLSETGRLKRAHLKVRTVQVKEKALFSSILLKKQGFLALVEPGGIEPPTSCMPCRRSPI